MMRRLSRSVFVKAPSSFALAYANTYFLERGPQSRGAELALRFPLPRFIVEGLTIEKRVMLQLKYVASGGNGLLTIGWQPLGVGPLPSFDGTLAAATLSDTTCDLTIAGSYVPPGGIAGIAFDELVGRHIASATITALLEQFRSAIENDYAARSIP